MILYLIAYDKNLYNKIKDMIMNKTKRILIMFMTIVCVITIMPINTYAATNKKVALSSKSISMDVGNNKVLKLNNAKGNITWKSSNTKIVSIKKKNSNSVTLSAKKKGNATITCTYKGKKYTCKVNITKPKMKYDTWEEETVMLGYINTVWVDNSSNTISWSIDDPTIASIKPIGNKNQKCEIEALTHGETTMRIVDGDTTHIMKVIVPEVKLDCAKVYMDGKNKYVACGIYYNTEYMTYYDENGNDITNTFPMFGYEGRYYSRADADAMEVQFVGTDIKSQDVYWESSDPDTWISENIWGDHYSLYCPKYGQELHGSVTFTTKLGNETFSFILEYDMCALPGR